tara:strand:+ start:36 stop:1388 length:1353 start_codon:yes stop_codon:yes gene_type:complete
MKKLFLLSALLILDFGFSQNDKKLLKKLKINWKMVDEDSIFPNELKTRGYLKINGKKTNEAEIYIDFDNGKLFYANEINKQLVSVVKEDFKGSDSGFIYLSIPEYKNGELIRLFDSEYNNRFSGEIAAELRKKVYLRDKDLNEIQIITGIKAKQERNNFNSKSPQPGFNSSKLLFKINDSLDLDVKNKIKIDCKLVSISPKRIEYIDSNGEVYIRNNTQTVNITLGDGKSNSEKRKEKKATKNKVRIVNISFGEKVFFNIQEFYKFIYDDYEKRFYSAEKRFKNDLIGENVMAILSNWGPFSEKYNISGQELYVWTYERSNFSFSSNTRTNSKSSSSTEYSSNQVSNADITSTSSSNSSYYSGGYGNVINYYGNTYGNSNSYINYYSKNSARQFTSTLVSINSTTNANGNKIDNSKKIGLIVDEKLIIKDVFTKNFFSDPRFGDIINFVD